MEAMMQEHRIEVEQLSAVEFAHRMAKDIEARRRGGPNLQAKYLELAEQLPPEIVAECKRSAIEVWGKVEDELAKRVVTNFEALRSRMNARFAEQRGRREAQAEEKPKDKPPKAEVVPLISKGTITRLTAIADQGVEYDEEEKDNAAEPEQSGQLVAFKPE